MGDKLIVATRNPEKLIELRRILDGTPQALPASDLYLVDGVGH